YRDIAVIVRDPKSYEGILDAVFSKYEIPYFMSSRKEIAEKPLVKLIFSAFSIIDRGFRGQDVITYLKTGLTGLLPDEVSLFENYIIKWNLRGKLFTGDEPWNMHPRGYGYTFADEDHGVLVTLADLRERVISPLKAFAGAYRGAKTVRERAELLFDFLSGLAIPDTLGAQAREAAARGERALSMETVQLWNALCETLDQLVTCAGDTEASAQEFSQMLMMLFLETDIGKIPTSVDEVVISGAAQTLSGGHRYVYLLGASEGGFPQRVSEDGIFSEYEKATLAPLGVELSDRLERRVSEELYYFCRAAVVPRERLYISYAHYSLSGAEQRESLGVKRIRKLFPALAVSEFELSERDTLVERPAASFEHAMAMGGELGRALREYYEGREDYAEKLRYMRIPLGAEKTVLSPENAELLFPGKLATSYTRLEKFIKCRFAYFCEYELRLRDDSPASFGAVDIGSFMHGVLEKTVRWIAEGGEESIAEGVRRIAGEYLGEIFHKDVENLPKRLQHLFHYLCRSAEIFAQRMKEEFAESDFRPLDFELSVSREGNAVTPMKLASEDVTVELRGKIDRVDAYEGAGGKLYIRVVDYKTGDKTFDLENISLGLDMQMLLYLFSIWENGEHRYGKEILPAGVLYAGIKPPQVDVPSDEEAREETIAVKASGLFLKDEGVLRAMDHELKGKWIPVKASDLKKDDAKKPKLMGLDAFLDLKESVRDTVLKYAAELKSGKANAEPLRVGGKSPCEYCRMRAVCRIRKS
ncbi:MAG: PD-(D/E)XK nuclease family protein, partial [Clostridia bacterium]|nr:PD-(D/E)XK nuclease family protein [Clostridia bacterium]